jgi:hypothetical protein
LVSHRAGCPFAKNPLVVFARVFLERSVGGALDIVVVFGTGALFGSDEALRCSFLKSPKGACSDSWSLRSPRCHTLGATSRMLPSRSRRQTCSPPLRKAAPRSNRCYSHIRSSLLLSCSVCIGVPALGVAQTYTDCLVLLMSSPHIRLGVEWYNRSSVVATEVEPRGFEPLTSAVQRRRSPD